MREIAIAVVLIWLVMRMDRLFDDIHAFCRHVNLVGVRVQQQEAKGDGN